MDKHTILKEKFGYDTFRPHQAEIIDAVMDHETNKGVLVIASTGSGKSILGQIPSLLFGGLNIVISPLISLMQDQVSVLRKKGIRASFYNSSLNEKEKTEIMNELQLGIIEILYIAPERLDIDSTFCEILSNSDVSLFCVDEAHSISVFSNFRPAYRKLKKAISKIRPKQVLCLTATATPRITKDIINQLGLTDPKIFVNGFYRDNLILSIEHAGGDVFSQVIDKIIYYQKQGFQSGIVYTTTRKDADALANTLIEQYEIDCLVYHGGMKDDDRKTVQDKWMANGGLIISTNAFGLGIDYAATRYVIHLGMCGSIENYAQEIGRAGRDSHTSYCSLFTNMNKDLWLQNFFIDTSCPPGNIVKKFWNWLNEQAETDRTVLMTQETMGEESGIKPAFVGGCISALKYANLVTTIKKGEYDVNYYPNPDEAPINFKELQLKRQIELDKLNDMVKFVNNTTKCRQLMLMNYFGDTSRSDPCGKCDICLKNMKAKR